MSDAWGEFLEKHNRSRGEMDAGMLFGSDAAPGCRVREVTQVAYRLNLVRPEVAVIDTSINRDKEFVGFFVAQMVPSIKKIYGAFSDELKSKFPDVSFFEGVAGDYDMLWWRSLTFTGDMSQYVARISQGGIAVVESMLSDSQQSGFEASLYLGHEAEVIIDRSECDAVSSLRAAGKPVPKTKYNNWLSCSNLGGYGIIYM